MGVLSRLVMVVLAGKGRHPVQTMVDVCPRVTTSLNVPMVVMKPIAVRSNAPMSNLLARMVPVFPCLVAAMALRIVLIEATKWIALNRSVTMADSVVLMASVLSKIGFVMVKGIAKMAKMSAIAPVKPANKT